MFLQESQIPVFQGRQEVHSAPTALFLWTWRGGGGISEVNSAVGWDRTRLLMNQPGTKFQTICVRLLGREQTVQKSSVDLHVVRNNCPAYIQGCLKKPCNRQVNRNSCRSQGQSVGSRRTLWKDLLRSLRVLGKRRPKGHSAGLASDRGETEHDLFSFYFNFVPELLTHTERAVLSFMSLITNFPVLTFPDPALFPCTLPPRMLKHTLNMSLQKSPHSIALEHLTLQRSWTCQKSPNPTPPP